MIICRGVTTVADVITRTLLRLSLTMCGDESEMFGTLLKHMESHSSGNIIYLIPPVHVRFTDEHSPHPSLRGSMCTDVDISIYDIYE